MKKVIWMVLVGLIGLTGAQATPQTSDADLKIAQAPVLTSSDGMNVDCAGLRYKLPPTPMVLAVANASEIDATAVSGLAPGPGNVVRCEFSGCPFKNGDATTLFSKVNTIINPVTLIMNGCSLTGTAVLVSQAGQSVNFKLADNRLTGVDLSGIPGLDLSFGGELDFSGNPTLSSVTAGDGTSSGITIWFGCEASFNGDALTAAAEDSLLEAAVATETTTPGQYGIFDFSAGTNAVPDATGADDISVLVAAGWMITTN